MRTRRKKRPREWCASAIEPLRVVGGLRILWDRTARRAPARGDVAQHGEPADGDARKQNDALRRGECGLRLRANAVDT